MSYRRFRSQSAKLHWSEGDDVTASSEMKLFIAYLGITTAFACQFKGKTYKNDEEWTENESFKMKCRIEPNGSWRTEVSGCVTPDKVVVPVNDQIDIGDHTWECKLNPGGRIVFEQKMNKHAACNGHPFGVVEYGEVVVEASLSRTLNVVENLLVVVVGRFRTIGVADVVDVNEVERLGDLHDVVVCSSVGR
ncbi:unnamed protein product [Nippostrongylus brasiliensis]|uniref:DUF3421 domain-containing protein n=1 Tax=Nippostrongylus brasiliensis TaxID=27835 RepID=A0A0N4YAG8_NIPBR|nr:unnamed protein product [Nippostrongylus brasiliensis]